MLRYVVTNLAINLMTFLPGDDDTSCEKYVHKRRNEVENVLLNPLSPEFLLCFRNSCAQLSLKDTRKNR